MRWGLLSAFVAVLLTACHGASSGTLTPTTITFEDVYVGASGTLDLTQFKLDGKPLVSPEFSLPPPLDSPFGPVSPFGLFGPGPLGAPRRLVFTPTAPGDYTTDLSVSVQGKVYSVPVQAKGLAPLTCGSASVPCQLLTFDPTSGRCVPHNQADGTRCGTPDCAGDNLCQNGTCTYVLRSDAPRICQPAPSTITLSPAWTYAADPSRAVSFSGVVDADGNLYLLDCPANDSRLRCDVVSLTPDGQLRWRTSSSASFTVSPLFQLSAIGHSIFVFYPPKNEYLFVLRSSDGSVAWQPDGAEPMTNIVAATSELAARVISGTDATKSSTVVFFAADTGEETLRLTDAIPGAVSNVVSDGQGVLYISSGTNDDPNRPLATISMVSVIHGVGWQIPLPDADSVLSTDGTRLFLWSGRAISLPEGKIVYSDAPQIQWINSTRQTGFTTTPGPGLHITCRDTTLRRFRLGDGVEQSYCRIEEDGVAIEMETDPRPTQDGGLVFLAAKHLSSANQDNSLMLRWVDQDGNGRLNAVLDGMVMQNPEPFLPPPVIVGSRWVTNGWVAPDRVGVFAYEVPGLALAEHGWLTVGGSQARNSAPW